VSCYSWYKKDQDPLHSPTKLKPQYSATRIAREQKKKDGGLAFIPRVQSRWNKEMNEPEKFF
jgi:hypothetical protein